jgi:hypothetical protein
MVYPEGDLGVVSRNMHLIFFNRCTVHFEDSLIITHQQMH